MFLLVGLPIYFLYWNLFRPVLLKRLKYRMYQVRDDLRLLLVGGEISTKEKAYPLVEQFCNKAVAKMDFVDLAVVFEVKLDRQSVLEAERDLEIIFDASPEIRHHFIHAILLVAGAAAANSPGVLILLIPFVFAALWFNKAKARFYGLMKKAFAILLIKPEPVPEPVKC